MSPSPVLIVGAGSDIARALAGAYAAAGRPLYLAARNPDRLARDAVDLRLRHRVPVGEITFDILDRESHRPLLDGLDPFPGTVVCVAGLLGDQAESARDPGAGELVMRTNYLAPALFLGETANEMEHRGAGAIIGISSVAGDRGRAVNYVYGSAKAGFTAFLSGLRQRLAPHGVRVITVKPGFVRTRMTDGMRLPPLLTAEPEEVARAVVAAEAAGRDILYVRPIWRLAMALVRAAPEPLFKHMRW